MDAVTTVKHFLSSNFSVFFNDALINFCHSWFATHKIRSAMVMNFSTDWFVIQKIYRENESSGPNTGINVVIT